MFKDESFDVIVIGAGIGGTICAALLSQAGFKTLILEKNAQVGGACSSYYKEGFIIDQACHIIPVGLKGIFGKVLKRCGLQNLKFSTGIATNSAIRLINTDYIKMGVSENEERSPEEAQENLKLLGFTSEEQEEMLKVSFKLLGISKRKIRQMLDEKVSLYTFLDSLTESDRIKSFLSWFDGLMFVIPPRLTSAGEFLRSYQEMMIKNDTSYPIGGCIAIPSAFVEGIKKFGGTVLTNTKVKQIVIENDRATGVELEDGTRIDSRIIISNLNIKQTIQTLVGPKYFENSYLNKVNNLKESWSSIVLKIALDKIIIPNFSSVHLFNVDDFTSQLKSIDEAYDAVERGEIPDKPAFMVPIPSNIDSNLAPPGKQLLICGSIGPPTREKQNWDPWIKKYYESILEFHPEIDDHKIFMDVSTPSPTTGKIEVTTNFSIFTGNCSVEGTALTQDQSGKYRISSQLPIDNLFVVGDSAGTDTHGIGTQIAADSGFKCAEFLINKYKLEKKIV